MALVETIWGSCFAFVSGSDDSVALIPILYYIYI